ncbi:cytochrome P450 4V2-like [Macrosteles quadrilineatus]|uniref:cytochrome P450 4V2-like n=1 Tax=Macrosteles quadrilineatus TaxID=74068 RepID=UPI0023E2E313|nr:cytochrome P450 4V2-like [Macrosteles quadrilineatus]
MEAAQPALWLSMWPTVYRVLRALVGLPPLLLVLALCWYHWKFRRVLDAARKLPTEVRTLPLLGHAHYVLYGSTEMVMTIVNAAKSSLAKGSKTLCLWLGPYPVVFVQRNEDVHTVLTSSKTSEKSNEYNFLRFALGNGLLIAPGHIHRITRRYVNPMFQPRNLEKLISVFNESGQYLVQKLSSRVGKGQFDVLPMVTSTSLRSVSCTLFGPDIKIDTESEEFRGLSWAVNMVALVELNRFFKIWLWPEPVFRLLWNKEINDIQDCWRKFAKGPLEELERKRNSQNKEIDTNENVLQDKKDSSSPLNLPDTYRTLRENHPEFQEKELHDELLTLVVTGVDSTKSAISSCLLSLAALPEIQELLYEEVVSVVGAGDSEVTMEDLNRMPYLDMIMKETLRKYSIIPIILRTVKEDLVLSDCTLPAGATVSASFYSLHHDPEVFPDPEKFDPERFSPENMAKLKKYSYTPFSSGSRNCIGKTYAYMLTKIAVIHVIRRYKLSTDFDIRKMRYSMALALVSDDGYPLKLEGR